MSLSTSPEFYVNMKILLYGTICSVGRIRMTMLSSSLKKRLIRSSMG